MNKPTLNSAALCLPGRSLGWLLTGLTLAFAPHVRHLPPWVVLLCVAMGVGRWAVGRRGGRLPPRLAVVVLALLGVAGVLLQYRTLLGRDAGVALLCLMLAAKVLELRTLRESMLAIFLGYFLAVTDLLYSQSPILALYLAGTVLVLTATLAEITCPEAMSGVRGRLRQAGTLLVQALPLALALFFLFPRIAGPLWGLPGDGAGAISGLSDVMEPGTISQLSLSDAVAFRVQFDGAPPPPAQRYWRGPVLWYTDGRRWLRHAPGVHSAAWPARLRPNGAALDYTVTLEPSRHHWLFALDVPAVAPPGASLSDDFVLSTARAIRTRYVYRVRSYLHPSTGALDPDARRRALQLPPTISARVRSLVARWRQGAPNSAGVVAKALDYFRTEPFVYTLRPPRLGDHPLDQFLFDTRAGFCEHYASAFTELMRIAGIPARVVTGYQGGEWNPVGRYLIVRQADAHAWSEVWLAGPGWVRVDPTAAVAPERIEREIDNVAAQVGAPIQFASAAPGWLREAVRRAGFVWDSLAVGWDRWVLGYGPRAQAHLLRLLGLGGLGWHALAVLLAIVAALMMAILAGALLDYRREPPDPVAQIYGRFCRRLARRGLVRAPHEGPLAFARRAGAARPDLQGAVSEITALYVALRYAERSGDDALETLRRRVRALRV